MTKLIKTMIRAQSENDVCTIEVSNHL